MQFRKKPVVIEAMQFTPEGMSEIAFWLGDKLKPGGNMEQFENGEIGIHTLEGVMHASWGDWIIKGVQGEFYPCKPEIFDQTYDKVE